MFTMLSVIHLFFKGILEWFYLFGPKRSTRKNTLSRINDDSKVEPPRNGKFSGLSGESKGTIFIEFLDGKIKNCSTREFYAIVIINNGFTLVLLRHRPTLNSLYTSILL